MHEDERQFIGVRAFGGEDHEVDQEQVQKDEEQF